MHREEYRKSSTCYDNSVVTFEKQLKDGQAPLDATSSGINM